MQPAFLFDHVTGLHVCFGANDIYFCSFLFWFMEEDLASPKWLLGMTNTVSSLAAIPVVASSTFLMKYFGHTKIMMFCFVIYGCRFLSYSIIYDPYHVLPVEILEAFTTSLFTVVSSVYCGKIAPDYLATLQGVVGGLHSAAGELSLATHFSITMNFRMKLNNSMLLSLLSL